MDSEDLLFLTFLPAGTVKASDKDKTTTTVKEKPALQPVVVPMVIKMAEFDHKV